MDIFDAGKRKQIMARVRSTDTKPELEVRRILHRLGYRFRLHKKDLPGTPDIVLSARRSVILVHGCFWHRHRRCRDASMPVTRPEFWKRKFAENTARDKRNSVAMTKLGWRVLVVWECELRNKTDLMEKLTNFLEGQVKE